MIRNCLQCKNEEVMCGSKPGDIFLANHRCTDILINMEITIVIVNLLTSDNPVLFFSTMQESKSTAHTSKKTSHISAKI